MKARLTEIKQNTNQAKTTPSEKQQSKKKCFGDVGLGFTFAPEIVDK